MEILFIILGVLSVIHWVYNHSSGEEKINAYIKERGGTMVSKEREYFDLVSMFSKYTRSYKLVYYDRKKVLRAVLLRVSYGNIDFIDDHVIHPSHKKYHVTGNEYEPATNQAREQTTTPMVDYTYKCDKGILIIQQEFYQPNKGESAFLNGEVAPDGKYRIGFMNYITIENSKVKALSMI